MADQRCTERARDVLQAGQTKVEVCMIPSVTNNYTSWLKEKILVGVVGDP